MTERQEIERAWREQQREWEMRDVPASHGKTRRVQRLVIREPIKRQRGVTACSTEPATPFGRVLRAVRSAKRLSQGAVARKAGLSLSYISRLEGGTRHPTADLVAALIVALNAAPDEADQLRGAAGFLPSDLAGYAGIDPLAVQLNTALTASSPDRQARLRIAVEVAIAGTEPCR